MKSSEAYEMLVNTRALLTCYAAGIALSKGRSNSTAELDDDLKGELTGRISVIVANMKQLADFATDTGDRNLGEEVKWLGDDIADLSGEAGNMGEAHWQAVDEVFKICLLVCRRFRLTPGKQEYIAPVLNKMDGAGESGNEGPGGDEAATVQDGNGESKPVESKRCVNELPERARKYFAKAIEARFMDENGDRYKWLFNGGSTACLAYFLKLVYDPDGCRTIPFKQLGHMFGVKRLDVALGQALNAKKKQRWRVEMDTFFCD